MIAGISFLVRGAAKSLPSSTPMLRLAITVLVLASKGELVRFLLLWWHVFLLVLCFGGISTHRINQTQKGTGQQLSSYAFNTSTSVYASNACAIIIPQLLPPFIWMPLIPILPEGHL